MLGVFLSVIVVGIFDQILSNNNVSSQEQSIVFGVLLLASVILPNAGRGYRAVSKRLGMKSSKTKPTIENAAVISEL